MSLLTLVRHGQASFFAEDYDRLSPLGERQARLLGEHWARERVAFTEIAVGPRNRQRETAEIAGRAMREAGLPWPNALKLDDLDEYDLNGLVQRLGPELAGRDREFEQLVADYRASVEERDRLKTFQTMFVTLLTHWQRSTNELSGVESWPTFRRRVRRAIEDLQARSDKGARVAMFTSGGFIGAAVQSALGAPDDAALHLNWRVLNCSLTDFVFTRERFTLDCFNGATHLSDPALRTYR